MAGATAVNLLMLYLLLVKATSMSFNGPTSLPVLRDDFVVKRHLLTDRQLNAAVVAGRCSPGPMGMYVVSAGYFAAGMPGAAMGFLALLTPAFLIIPLVQYGTGYARRRRVKSMMEAVVIACAGLVIVSAEPLARDAVTGILPAVIMSAAGVLLVWKRVETVWLIAGAALVMCAAALVA
jgi:chromate transporter